jgi:hypothetical protein
LQTLASQALAIQEAQRDELLARIDYNELYKTKADAQQLIDMIKGQPALYNALNEKDKLLEFVIKSETRLDDIIIKYKKQ